MFGKLFEIQTNATRRVRLKGTDKTLTVESVVRELFEHGRQPEAPAYSYSISTSYAHKRVVYLEFLLENFILCFALDAAKLNKIAGADLWEDV